ncbi:SDR family NAD(P)-dependent oxidoreductase [Parahaliea mediterranea]|uniref:SDR family NAD(P)-dependent oxidoreductase n=1 Tax=Parahaliea mediterranea TaxID=651086 RepID=A0A939DH22_9GAMM|nr:SDR family NAD(P)-dependent oxidoreductase [Parahaliea mediterranea]MBN7797949.1 SDR family NAD(P)-dependent oxidoreductase [Parahaliea mediterranea]
MIELHEKFEVDRPRAEVFAYLRDFRSAAEWDHTTRSARKATPGPVDVGSRFDLVCKLPLGTIDIEYTVTHLEPGRALTLQGQSRLFAVTDVIHFSDTATGCHIDYRAHFAFHGPLAALEPAMRNGMARMGRKAVAGMRRALQDDFPPPAAASDTRRADAWLVPGVALFSSAGYRRGRKRWNPVSAWMGDKHALITGASSGLGYATALELARTGAALTLVIRDEAKAQPLVAALRRETGNEHIYVELADLRLMREVDALVQRLTLRDRPIDILVNNAGALFTQWGQTDEGLEQSFALLLLAPYRLTRGLKPLLRQAPAPRVINVVSGGMYSQRLEVGRLQAGSDGYSGAETYARAKRALMVLTEQWAADWAREGIVVNAMHPGWADTPGVAKSLPGFRKLTRRILRSPDQGADTIVWLARATEAGKVSGQLFLDREPRPTHLLARTQESPGERAALREYMEAVF